MEAPLAEEDAARLSVLDALTGIPRQEDLLLFAVPVCGPYAALQAYKYKVKVTPGEPRDVWVEGAVGKTE